MSFTETEYQFCNELTQKLIDNPLCLAFLYPVERNEEWSEKYFSMIENPMDLSTVKENLEERRYANAANWFKDINLIWDNAMLFNGKGSVIYDIASFLKGKCEAKFALIPKTESEMKLKLIAKANKKIQELLNFELPQYSLVPKADPQEMQYQLAL